MRQDRFEVFLYLPLTMIAFTLLLPTCVCADVVRPWSAERQPWARFSLAPPGMRQEFAQVRPPEPPAPQPPTPLPPTPQLPEPAPPEPQPLPEPAEPQAIPSPEPERPKSEAPQDQLLLEAGALLLRRGILQLEPSLEYSYFSNNRVAISGLSIFDAIVIGTIRVDRLDRDFLTAALTARYGLLNRLQVQFKLPYVYRSDTEVLGVGTSDERENTVEGNGLGDIETAVSWQPFIGRRGWPGVILRLRARFPTGKDPFEVGTQLVEIPSPTPEGMPRQERRLSELPTGSGFYGLEPNVTLVWRSDPVVLFVGGGYTWNIERNVGQFGRIDPGDIVELLAGLNLALNERVSLNASFVDQISTSTTQGGVKRPGTSFSDARLILGASFSLSSNISLLIAAAAGLTEQSPDFQINLNVPISFKLF